MAGTIRACFANGGLEPLEHLDVPEGEILTITIIRLPPEEQGAVLSALPEVGKTSSMRKSSNATSMLTA